MRYLAATTALALLAACTVGPNYVRPTADTPAAFKEMEGWKTAQPRDRELRGKWWETFNDPLLNDLEEQVSISNQNLVQATAQFRQARALVQSARSGYLPTVSGGASVTRGQSSSNLGNQNQTFVQNSRSSSTSYSLPLDAVWELDLWGRVRRTVESNEAGAQASAADLEALRLSVQAELAQNYFQLRALDAQKQLFDDTIAAYQRSLTLTQNQYTAGVVAKVDVIQAQTQLKTTQAQALDIGVLRAQLEHAIALLIGKPASSYSLVVAPLTASPPPRPAGIPSSLLERRPDIAAAERRMAAANAQIGVAEAAYYPSLTLSASGGFQSSSFSNWLTAPSRFWSLGPALAQTLFDGGLRRAQTDQAIAAYDANVAGYRQTVLTGFKEVEDNLVALRILEEEAAIQNEAVQNARQSVALTTNQYKAGIVSYLNVVTVQATALVNERTAVDVLNRRLAASVLLVKALGGGWNASGLPTPDELARGDPYPRKDAAPAR
ncbi:MAG: efflux transporter outer membrane subunit [Betaproteobacteria bacterium]|nr:efflux transporter outer membrane subunit [Betaproteobacteria bacterium]